MAKTQYYTATSIDGFIADRDNSLDWLVQADSSAGKENRFAGFFAGVGAMAMGATTYEWVVEYEHLLEDPRKWRQWYGAVPCWVFTHRRLPAVPGADLVFAHGDVRSVHEEMTTAADGRNLWLVGGGNLVGQFADQGLLDEILLGIAPVMLGEGIALLPRRLLAPELSLATVGHDAQFVFLTYQVTRREGRRPVTPSEVEGGESAGCVAGMVTGGGGDVGGAADECGHDLGPLPVRTWEERLRRPGDPAAGPRAGRGPRHPLRRAGYDAMRGADDGAQRLFCRACNVTAPGISI